MTPTKPANADEAGGPSRGGWPRSLSALVRPLSSREEGMMAAMQEGGLLSRHQLDSVGAASGGSMSIAGSASSERREANPNDVQVANVKALTFDVFGTVVDWRSSIIREGQLLSEAKGLDVDWATFADRWRSGYAPAMNRVRTGELPWMKIDGLHRLILDELLQEFEIKGLSPKEVDELNRVWHRLIPWPDSVPGLNRMRSRYILATLSNGNISLLVHMAKRAGLPWDCVLSAELSRHYKPDEEVYRTAAELLDLPPENIMMVAAHKQDLRAATGVGFKTGFVRRPLEYGPNVEIDTEPDASFDINAHDFLDLAHQLGA